ncbi:YjjG family noncanonical pyrimidine nucleotidase [Aerococcaceae bacterium NML160702]|nr:YjjG family noncanonical pyrimidine nucleotidase [Aerococcaceae bacterium NML171108]MCW6679703.1 YjjG family noncanonical pyrimidine nucleotidase [Aerococcaceae bacterium NML130460]MCW6681372.1 YjjG family noncanonical pyrimidine nucleotidase [Aerococcaceae bacterium NML160702]
MYNDIFLDLDNTILDFSKSQAHAFEQICQELEVTYSATLLQTFIHYNLALWEQLEVGKLTKDALLAKRFPDFFAQYGVTLSGTETDDRFRHYLSDYLFLVDGAEDFMAHLKERGYRIYAASNGVYNTQVQRLEKANFLHYFDDLFISEKLGVAKPNTLFFERSVETLGSSFQKERALMIGDSLSSDIKGANNFGMDVCWINPNKEVLPKGYSVAYNVAHLDELRNIL